MCSYMPVAGCVDVGYNTAMLYLFRVLQMSVYCQDPSDKRYIMCDDTLKQLLGVDRFQAFGLQKLLSDHINK